MQTILFCQNHNKCLKFQTLDQRLIRFLLLFCQPILVGVELEEKVDQNDFDFYARCITVMTESLFGFLSPFEIGETT